MELRLVYSTDPKLREVAQEVTKFDMELQTLASAMLNLMVASGGVGLAANQVGILKRILVMQSSQGFEVMVNPIITAQERECYMTEGCLSFPGLSIGVKRPETINVLYKDIAGNTRNRRMNGLDARIVLHEIDHLNGKVFTDYDENEPVFTEKR